MVRKISTYINTKLTFNISSAGNYHFSKVWVISKLIFVTIGLIQSLVRKYKLLEHVYLLASVFGHSIVSCS